MSMMVDDGRYYEVLVDMVDMVDVVGGGVGTKLYGQPLLSS